MLAGDSCEKDCGPAAAFLQVNVVHKGGWASSSCCVHSETSLPFVRTQHGVGTQSLYTNVSRTCDKRCACSATAGVFVGGQRRAWAISSAVEMLVVRSFRLSTM